MADEWLAGWDPTPGIVGVWADGDGTAHVWRRVAERGNALVHERVASRPWLLLAHAEDVVTSTRVTVRELAGEGALRFMARADDLPTLKTAVLQGAARRLGHALGHIRELGEASLLLLPPEEQYLVASGRTYFRDLPFSAVHRLQFDLETTGLEASTDRIFLIAVRDPDGTGHLLEATAPGDAGEAELIARLVAHVRRVDPDVIENHNLHGFDLPFLAQRAKRLAVPLGLGRIGPPGLTQRGARRGVASDRDASRRTRYVIAGRESIDTLDAVLRHDFGTRELVGHGLKVVARQLGIAGPEREYIRGAQIHTVYLSDPDRVRRYATADVDEVEALARLLGGPAFALARMVPRRYERLADAGPATGVIDPLLVRAYLRANQALPAHVAGDGTQHQGAALHLFAAGVAHRIVKADVASLYPSLMRTYRIGPARDRLGVLLGLVDRLVEQRLAAKAAGRAAAAGSLERGTHEAMSNAMKLVVNSAYGYLGAGGLTRFADIHAANEVTRRGREVLGLLCRELRARGGVLLEADTDGVYFAVPESWTEADERRTVAEVGALLPPLVRLEYDGRYAAMLSHEPKNYALLGYDGTLTLRGVAFRSSRAEPFGEAFLREAIRCLLVGDLPGVRAAYLRTIDALRHRRVTTFDVSSRMRLSKAPFDYLATRATRHEVAYEAVLASGRTTWRVGERVRVYRTRGGGAALAADPGDDRLAAAEVSDPRDYDLEHYERVLLANFASRLARALLPDDFATVFADPDQLSLFAPSLATIQPVLTELPS